MPTNDEIEAAAEAMRYSSHDGTRLTPTGYWRGKALVALRAAEKVRSGADEGTRMRRDGLIGER